MRLQLCPDPEHEHKLRRPGASCATWAHLSSTPTPPKPTTGNPGGRSVPITETNMSGMNEARSQLLERLAAVEREPELHVWRAGDDVRVCAVRQVLGAERVHQMPDGPGRRDSAATRYSSSSHVSRSTSPSCHPLVQPPSQPPSTMPSSTSTRRGG
jgi:hypothetical protein